jgi:uncharacterized protein YlxW (UPF0749 family)
MNTLSNLSTLSLTEKRALLADIKLSIKNEVLLNKAMRINQKAAKEQAKKDKLQNAIKAAQDKLAKLQARLA